MKYGSRTCNFHEPRKSWSREDWGKLSKVQYTNDLASGNWTTFTNNAPGNGYLLWVTNSGGANQFRRFYRGAIIP